MGSEVLATWRRIIEGEEDAGGELTDGEADVRRYLTKVRDPKLVKEYGSWLARRHPSLGVQVFADETSRVRFTTEEALSLLKSDAPNAVKDYLEHLVFDKQQTEHMNSLIDFYLDAVLHELDTSASARTILKESYDTYRALGAPKPTYEQFMRDNATDAVWFRNRLSLLELISQSAGPHYDYDKLSQRLEPYSDVLVPEMIMLNGRRGRDTEALRLLMNGLGDYDTAIRYCLAGGYTVFCARAEELPTDHISAPTRQDQCKLFDILLRDGYLKIPDASERRDRTAELLEKYSAWYSVGDILFLIPDDWPIDCLTGFLGSALRRLESERKESDIVKALCGVQNLRQSATLIEKIESMGVKIETTNAGPDSAYHSMASF